MAAIKSKMAAMVGNKAILFVLKSRCYELSQDVIFIKVGGPMQSNVKYCNEKAISARCE